MRDDFRTFAFFPEQASRAESSGHKVELTVLTESAMALVAEAIVDSTGSKVARENVAALDVDPATQPVNRPPWERTESAVPEDPIDDGMDPRSDSGIDSPQVERVGSHWNHIETVGTLEPYDMRSFPEPIRVSQLLMARYNREELYSNVWTMPLQKLAKLYGKSDTGLGILCRKLHVPLPGVGYWNKKAAGKPVDSPPCLPPVQIGPQLSNASRTGQQMNITTLNCTDEVAKSGFSATLAQPRISSFEESAKTTEEEQGKVPDHEAAVMDVHESLDVCCSPTVPAEGANRTELRGHSLQEEKIASLASGPVKIAKAKPVSVSPTLMTRYNREELYEKVWATPVRDIARKYGVSDVAIGKVCRRLLIPLPGRGYWAKKAANRPVKSRPPLPHLNGMQSDE